MVYFNIRNTLPKSGTFLLEHSVYTGGAKKCIDILRDITYVLLFEVELNYGSNV